MASGGCPMNIPALSELLSQLKFDEEESNSGNTQETALSAVHGSPYNISNFEAFLLRSHCAENFEFWKYCNHYLAHHNEADFNHKDWSKKVYENFIQENSSMECNLPDRMRKHFIEWYQQGIIPEQEVILRARQHAIDLMSDAYRHFIRYTNVSNSTISTTASISSNATCTSTVISTMRTGTNRAADLRNPVRRSNSSNNCDDSEDCKRVSLIKSTLEKASKSAESLSSLVALSSQDSDMEDTHPQGLMRSNSSGSHNFLDRGLALVTKLKRKTLRPRLTSSSSSSNNVTN